MPTGDNAARPKASGLTNALASISGQLAPLLAFLLAAPFLLGALGAEAFGVLTLLITATAVVASVDFGLSSGAIRSLGIAYHSEPEHHYREALREWWSAYLLLAITASAVALFASPWLGKFVKMHLAMESETGEIALYAFSLSIVAAYASAAAQLVARSREQFVGLTLIQASNGLLLWVGLVLVVAFGGGVNGALCWIPISMLIGFTLHAAWAHRLSGGGDWTPIFEFSRVKASLPYCLHAFWSQLTGTATYQADKFIVSRYLGTAQTGHYGLLTNISSKLLLLVATIAGFVFPRIVRLQSSAESAGIRHTYIRASRYTLLVSWPAFIVLAGLTAPFLKLWLGQEIAGALTQPMLILLLAYFINSLSVVGSSVFNGLGDAGIGARFSTISGAGTVVGGMLLTPWAGLNGMALAALLASLQVFFYTHTLHKRLGIGVFPLRGIWLRLLAASVAPLGLLVFSNFIGQTSAWPGLFVTATMAYSLFYVVWFLARFADEGDLLLVKNGLDLILRHISR